MENEKLEVLVVEDQHFSEAREAAVAIVEENPGVNVTVLETAAEAYEVLVESRIDFLLTDLMFVESLEDGVLKEEYLKACDLARNYAENNTVPHVTTGDGGYYNSTEEKLAKLDNRMRTGRSDREEIEELYEKNKYHGWGVLRMCHRDKRCSEEFNEIGRSKNGGELRDKVYHKYIETFESVEQYALGNVLFFKALEQGIPACVLTTTHCHEVYIDGTYLVAPLAAKGLIKYNPREGDVRIGDPNFPVGFEKIGFGRLEDVIPVVVVNAKKSVEAYKHNLNKIIQYLQKSED